jgi:hypothetical protein
MFVPGAAFYKDNIDLALNNPVSTRYAVTSSASRF